LIILPAGQPVDRAFAVWVDWLGGGEHERFDLAVFLLVFERFRYDSSRLVLL
jgi:hypothetical protein